MSERIPSNSMEISISVLMIRGHLKRIESYLSTDSDYDQRELLSEISERLDDLIAIEKEKRKETIP